jgi:adenylate cyclase
MDAMIWFLVGAGLGAALAWLGLRFAAGKAALARLARLREMMEKAGLAVPKAEALSPLKPAGAEAAVDELVEKGAYFAMQARKEKEKFQDALGKYADPTLSARLKEQTSFAGVGTNKVRVAILFCDIRGFTKMSETLKVEEVVYVLNDYFTLGSKVIADNGGQINKFIGDAILAVFQDPPGYSTGATACRNAVAAGLELNAAYRRQRSLWQNKISTPFDTDLGVGVHFGELIMGNFGSPQRMEYTVIGDTVNFASRLCSLAAAGQLKLSEETYKNVSAYFTADEMEPVKVKGKSGEYKTFLVTGKKPGA